MAAKKLKNMVEPPTELIKKTTRSLCGESKEAKAAVRMIRECLFTSGKIFCCVNTIPGLFSWRNVLVALSSLACILTLAFILAKPAFVETGFPCEPIILADSAYTRFQCTHHLSKILQFHIVLICCYSFCLLAIALACIGHFTPSSKCGKERKFSIDFNSKPHTNMFRRAMYNALFLAVFNDHSRSLGKLTSALLKVEASDWLKEIVEKRKSSEASDDDEVKDLHWRMVGSANNSGSGTNPDAQDMSLEELCRVSIDKGWYQVYIAAHSMIHAAGATGNRECRCGNARFGDVKTASDELIKYILAIKRDQLTGRQDIHRMQVMDVELVDFHASCMLSKLTAVFEDKSEAASKGFASVPSTSKGSK